MNAHVTVSLSPELGAAGRLPGGPPFPGISCLPPTAQVLLGAHRAVELSLGSEWGFWNPWLEGNPMTGKRPGF